MELKDRTEACVGMSAELRKPGLWAVEVLPPWQQGCRGGRVCSHSECQCSKGCWFWSYSPISHCIYKIHLCEFTSQGLFPHIILCCFCMWKLVMVLHYLCQASFHFKNVVFLFAFFESITCRIGWQLLLIDVVSLYHFAMFSLEKTNKPNTKPNTPKALHQKSPLKTLNHTFLQLEFNSVHTLYLLMTKLWEKLIYLCHLNEQIVLLNTSLRNN